MDIVERRQRAEKKKIIIGLAIFGLGLLIALLAYLAPWTFLSGILWIVAVVATITGIVFVMRARVPIKHVFALALIIGATWFFTSLTPQSEDAYLIVTFSVAYLVAVGIMKLAK